MNTFKIPYNPTWFYTLPTYQVNSLKRLIRHNPQACKKNKIPQGYGQFGFEKTNPIPVYGMPEIETYLSKLRLNNGSKIRWQSDGKTSANNIKESIEQYKIYKQNGNLLTILYFSPYHLLTSDKAPKGFKFKT
ncbi:hypothetical protein RHO14_03495 [Orbus wheelerorum]|uniref:hypothetical protein n=1 Tax=Orbus wheelerorum TaxID=3074111 RepID=UPI00370D172B